MDINDLIEWNPWWEKKQLIEELQGSNRLEYSVLLDSINIKEITIITGVRRSGKSTLMYQMIANLLNSGIDSSQILFVNLEDKKLSKISLDEIYSTYRENLNLDKKAFIFLDEIHKKNEWEHWIRKKYDLKTKDKFVISGSSSYLLKKEYSTLLTGRNLTLEVFPLTFKEFLLFKKINLNEKNLFSEKTKRIILKNFKEYLNLGGFPEIAFKPLRFKRKILEQYFDDILYKDIIDRHNLNSEKAKNLALFLITNFSEPFSLRKIRNNLGIAYDTTKEYLSFFKEAFLLFTVDNFSYSFMEQKSNPSKIYCIDNGLRNSVAFNFSKNEGKLAENLVFIELKRKEKEVYYWKNDSEIDFIVKNKDNSLEAINVSYTNKISERETKGLNKFKQKFKNTKKLIILTQDLEKKEKGIQFIPLWKWLLK